MSAPCHRHCTAGLFCADGQRGVFGADNKCQRIQCGRLAMDHSTQPRCEEKR